MTRLDDMPFELDMVDEAMLISIAATLSLLVQLLAEIIELLQFDDGFALFVEYQRWVMVE
ncbi:hypothetical protein KW842_04295 [Duganella sp. sic0402]|uniref:hypothetical protein n=1 Tax=Duganella sp. sic0402 TaxID=2854786 RepID=UPI001C436D56|nr:hypothetical protein [Duganella sp. sic0402]MBV7534985.1 hypothetical protein [Duganella sp. sic0402]